MTPRSWLLLLAACCGCAHVQPPRTPVTHPSPIAVQAAPIPLLEFPALGLRVRVPGQAIMTESDHELSDGTMHVQGVGSTVASQAYFVGRYFRGGRDRAKDETLLEAIKKTMNSVSHETPIELSEWQGIELEGTNEKGYPAWTRGYAFGDGFWFARVESTGGALDGAAARAFFDSIVLTQPWSVHAFPEGHFSALLPDGAIVLGKKELKLETMEVAQSYFTGGREKRGFLVLAVPLEGSLSADERLDFATEGLTHEGNRVVWQAPIVIDGARGRDFLLQNKEGWTRVRLIITDSHLYELQAGARSKEALQDESVPRFLESIRWY